MSPNPLRNIPSLNELLESPPLKAMVDRLSRSVVVSTAHKVLDEMRTEVQTAASEKTFPSVADLAERIARRIAEDEAPPLRPVINATGVLLHRELGPPPLADEALEEMVAVARDYASVELDLAGGGPAPRKLAVEDLLRKLTGAEAAVVVGSEAGATMLTLAALAAPGEVIVSRGELGETGDGCRLTEIIAASGARLREVGTTNRTRLDDYAEAIGPEAAALMLVHPSSFAVVGSSAGVALEQLVTLGRGKRLPVIHHVGTAALVDLGPFGLEGEPLVGESIKTGADVVLLGGEKLLGGPPCGIILGRSALVEKIERHPTARTLRVDKLTLAALAATLRLYRDGQKARLAVPLLHLLTTSAENLKNRAERLAPQMAAVEAIDEARPLADTSPLGSDVLSTRCLPTWCVALRPAAISVDRLAAALRTGTPSVVGRVRDDRLLLDLRTVLARQDVELVAALESLGGEGG